MEPGGDRSRQSAPAQRTSRRQQQRQMKKQMKRKATGKAGRGWGPFRSVLKERSVDFNLTLDVQSLRQDIQTMLTLRELLQTKALLQRDAVDGSLLKTVREFYRVFRCGFQVAGDPRKRAFSEREQWDFIYSAMDEQLDVGNGLYGNELMGQQLQNYSTFIRFLCLSLRTFDIISAENSVVIATIGTFRFQVLRNTIKQIFPHIMGNEELVGRLIGQQIEVLAKLTFYFNESNKCVKYEVDIDYLSAFAKIVKDPHDLNLLFGRALIAGNCMFGLLEVPDPASTAAENLDAPDVSVTVPVAAQDIKLSSLPEYQEDYQSTRNDHPTGITTPAVVALLQLPKDEAHKGIQWANQLVQTYFAAFAPLHTLDSNEFAPSSDQPISEQRFLDHYCDSRLLFHQDGKWLSLEEKWSVFRWCFDIIEFQQVESSVTGYEEQFKAHGIHTIAVYVLDITPQTLELVFPQVQDHPHLVSALLNTTIHVKSKLTFWVSDLTAKIYRIDEHMDFETALARLLPHPQDLAFVLHAVKVNLDGLLLGRSRSQ